MTTPAEKHVNIHPFVEVATSGSPHHERKRLQLKPRTSLADSGGGGGDSQRRPRRDRQRQRSSKGNPFGDAVPREEILQKRGVDVRNLDAQLEIKAGIRNYTPTQDAQLDKVRKELEEVTTQRQEANEKELPEETYRLAEEAKRKELNDLLQKFDKLNMTDKTPKTEKFTSTTKLLDEAAPRRNGGSNRGWQRQHREEAAADQDPVFASFQTSSRRGGGSGQYRNFTPAMEHA